MIGPKAYIHSDRLQQNIWNIRRQIGERMLMVVVKADGYGHGALNIASVLAGEPGIIFCVFTIAEAKELREGGISNKILIFSRMQREWLDQTIEYDLWVNASTMEDLKALQEFQNDTGECPAVHLKFDTGMTRLGFDAEQAYTVYQFLANYHSLPIEGIYSHFATADEGDLSYAEYQLKQFNTILKLGKDTGIDFKYTHCSNSGAVLNLPKSYFNSVRVGMLAYGVAPSDEVSMDVDVEPVMSFCGPVVNIRRVKPGTQVSYGGVYTTRSDSNIAVVQMGFADGFPRPWYENGYVSYQGQHFKIAGRACMDQFMVDFEDVEPSVGDEVLIFGKKDGNQIPIESIAEEVGTTTYVLLTAIHGRTERIMI